MLTVESPATAARGSGLKYRAELVNGEGLIPVRIKIVSADGKTVLTDHYNVLKNGVLEGEITIPFNAPDGTFRIFAEELATGQKQSCQFSLTR